MSNLFSAASSSQVSSNVSSQVSSSQVKIWGEKPSKFGEGDVFIEVTYGLGRAKQSGKSLATLIGTGPAGNITTHLNL